MRKTLFGLIFILLLGCVVLSGCSNNSQVEKMKKIEDVPDVIIDDLKQSELKPGYYYFNSNFTKNNYEYIAICSDVKNEYDVEIINAQFERSESHPDIINLLTITIEELSKTTTNYTSSFNKPIVIFRFPKGLGLPNSIEVIAGEERMKMNSWKGSEIISGNTNDLVYEIVQSKEDIPNDIWLKMNNSKLERGIYEFNPLDYSTDSLYLLVSGGEEMENSYSVTFEDIPVAEPIGLPDGKNSDVFFSLHEYINEDSLSYTKETNCQYVLINIKSKKGHKLTISRSKWITLFNQSGEERSLQVFIINKQ